MYYLELKDKYNKLDSGGFILQSSILTYENYLFYDKSRVKYKNRTILETLLELNRFDKFLLLAYPDLEEITDIEAAHIEDYKRFCKEGLKNNNITINKKLRAIRQFFDYLRNTRHSIEHNVALEVSYLYYAEAKHPSYIPKSKLKILTNNMNDNKNGIRDICITELLAYNGLQINEVFGLTTESINLNTKELYVKRENGTVTFSIADTLYVDLKDYLLQRSEICTESSDNSLFISNSGNPYPIREYQRKFKMSVIKSDFKEPYKPRNARASFAYYMANVVEEDNLKKILNQDKVNQYYTDNLKINPLLSEKEL